jgi:hypothetical protein
MAVVEQCIASLQTYYGKASSGWKIEGNKIIMDD